MADQKGFILYLDQYAPIAGLSLDQKGMLLEAMFAFHAGKPYELKDPLVGMAFGFFKAGFEREKQKHTAICTRRKAAAEARWGEKSSAPVQTMQVHASASGEMQTMQVHFPESGEMQTMQVHFPESGEMQTMPYQDQDQEQEIKNTHPLPLASEGEDDAAPPTCSGNREEGTNPRAQGTNPRAQGENPRAVGENPRALGTNPRKARVSHVASASYPADFEAFWQGYPRKVGKDAAFKAWKRKRHELPKPDELAAILARQCHCEQWQRDGGQYIPHPATWLNQGRWQDELEPTAGLALADPEGW